MSVGKFNIVYADPPWRYDYSRSKRREIENHYPTMTVEEIMALNVREIAADDSIALVWGTWPKLKECIAVIEAWGFRYRTVAFVWVKTNERKAVDQGAFFPEDSFDEFFGMGNWTRSNTEFCLIGTKGEPKRLSAGVRQIIYQPIREHSRKPEEAKKRIVEMMGDMPRVELFAREATLGWSVWGNEVESTVRLERAI